MVQVFQFLLGTLKTVIKMFVRKQTSWFQFLLGTLKTSHYIDSILSEYRVSIPFRYAENQYPAHPGVWNQVVSIPFRYAENSSFVFSATCPPARFNSF